MTKIGLNWRKYSPHPSITLILGKRGSYKTSTMCSLLDSYHREKINCYLIGTKEYVKNYPSWMKRISEETLNVPNDSAVGIDDAQLVLFSRNWSAKGERAKREMMTFLSTESRQKDISFVINTQNASFVDRNIIAMCDTVIIRKVSVLQSSFERSELRSLMQESEESLKGKSMQHAYIVYADGKEVVNTGDPPKWFNTKISKGHRDRALKKKTQRKNSIGKDLINILKIIGS